MGYITQVINLETWKNLTNELSWFVIESELESNCNGSAQQIILQKISLLIIISLNYNIN